MTFQQALAALHDRDQDLIDEARTVVIRAVCDEIGIVYAAQEAELLGDWIAAVEYSGAETPASLAAAWQSE